MVHSSDSLWLILIIMVFTQLTSSWTHLGSRIVVSRQNCCASGDRVERLAGTGHCLAVGMMGKRTSGWWDEKGKGMACWRVNCKFNTYKLSHSALQYCLEIPHCPLKFKGRSLICRNLKRRVGINMHQSQGSVSDYYQVWRNSSIFIPSCISFSKWTPTPLRETRLRHGKVNFEYLLFLMFLWEFFSGDSERNSRGRPV